MRKVSGFLFAPLTAEPDLRLNKNFLGKLIFYTLLDRYAVNFKGNNRKLKNKLYSVDSTVIDLCLSLFGWAKFRTTKAGIKLHTQLDHDGYIPSFAAITNQLIKRQGDNICQPAEEQRPVQNYQAAKV